MVEAAPKEADVRADVAKLNNKAGALEERITNLEEALSSLEESLGASANLLETLVEFKTYAQEKLKEDPAKEIAELKSRLEEPAREIAELKNKLGEPAQELRNSAAKTDELQKEMAELKTKLALIEQAQNSNQTDAIIQPIEARLAKLEETGAELPEISARLAKSEQAQEGLRKDVEKIDLSTMQQYVTNLESSILKIIESQEKLQQRIEHGGIKEAERKIKEFEERLSKTDFGQIDAKVEELKNAQQRIEDGGIKEINAKIGRLEEKTADALRLAENFRTLQNNLLHLADDHASAMQELQEVKKAAPVFEKALSLQKELETKLNAITNLRAELEADNKARQELIETLRKSGFAAKSVEDLRNLMTENAKRDYDAVHKEMTEMRKETAQARDALTGETGKLANELALTQNKFTAKINGIESDIKGFAENIKTREDVLANRLSERINDMKSLQNTLTADVANLRTNNDGQFTRIGTSLKNLNEVIVGKIKTMDGKITTNAEAINIISKSLRSELDGVKEAIPQHFAEMDRKLAEKLTNTGADKIAELEDRLSEDRILIGKMTALIKKLQESYNPSRMNETRAKVERLEAIINAVESGKPELMGKVSSLEMQMSKIDAGRIMSLIDKIENVKDEISRVSSKAYPEKYAAKLNELDGKLKNIESTLQDHSKIHETVQDLNVKLSVMKDHVKTIREELAKKKETPIHERNYLVLD